MVDQVPGGLTVHTQVIAELAGYAALECYGVVGMTSPNYASGSIDSFIPRLKQMSKGVVVSAQDGKMHIDLNVKIEDGVNIVTVCKNLEERVLFVLKEVAQVTPDQVTVHVRAVKGHA